MDRPPYRIALTSDLHYGYGGSNGQLESDRTKVPITNMLKELSRKKFDILVLAGDTISHSQFQWSLVLPLIRRYLPDTKILAVMGNHDYWQEKITCSVQQVIEHQKKMLEKYDIHYLHDSSFTDKGVTFHGVDGWYANFSARTNDPYWMPKKVEKQTTNDFLFERSMNRLAEIPGKDPGEDERFVFVTHFEPNDNEFGGPTAWLDDICKKSDILLVGHSHKECDKILTEHDGIRMINSGSHYCLPKYKIIEV